MRKMKFANKKGQVMVVQLCKLQNINAFDAKRRKEQKNGSTITKRRPTRREAIERMAAKGFVPMSKLPKAQRRVFLEGLRDERS